MGTEHKESEQTSRDDASQQDVASVSKDIIYFYRGSMSKTVVF